MEHIYLVGAIACLAVSWIYILFLKAKIRDCMRYIEDRIDKTNSGGEHVEKDHPSPAPASTESSKE
jgi:hypothetical protein